MDKETRPAFHAPLPALVFCTDQEARVIHWKIYDKYVMTLAVCGVFAPIDYEFVKAVPVTGMCLECLKEGSKYIQWLVTEPKP